jgi:hypothetical protein
MSKRIRLAVTAINGRVIAGFENAKGTQITEGSRQDVTSDFMKALIDKGEHHDGEFENRRWRRVLGCHGYETAGLDMIWWLVQQIAGFWWTCLAIVIFCDTFGIPIHINLT